MTGLANSSNALQQWHHLFETRGETRLHHAQQHLQQMLRLGLPTHKHEDWKYTPLEGLTNSQFASHVTEITSAQCATLSPTIDAIRLVFIDGQFFPTLSNSTDGSGFDITIDDAHQVLPAAIQPEAFLYLTESLSCSVTHIQVKHNQRPARPLLPLRIIQGLAGDEMSTAHYHHHLELAGGAEATVIEHYTSLGERRHFTGARLTVDIAVDAHLHHTELAFENSLSHYFTHSDVQLGADAAAVNRSFLFGNAVLRHNANTQLDGENTTLRLNSLVVLVKNEVCDTRTWLEHNKGYRNSRQLHKTIVGDKERAVFNGLINIAQHAIKTDGQITNSNLLFRELAEVDTKPQLETYADDVKCSHGATVERVGNEQMFYLRPRGIGQRGA